MPYPVTGNTVLARMLQYAAADVAEAKAITTLTAGALLVIQGRGYYRYVASYAGPYDDEVAIQVTSGGALILEAAHPDMILGMVQNELATRDDLLEDAFADVSKTLHRLVQLIMDLAFRLESHRHTGVATGSGTSGLFDQAPFDRVFPLQSVFYQSEA